MKLSSRINASHFLFAFAVQNYLFYEQIGNISVGRRVYYRRQPDVENIIAEQIVAVAPKTDKVAQHCKPHMLKHKYCVNYRENVEQISVTLVH